MQDLSDELNAVFKLLEKEPETSRISADGKRLYIVVEGQICCLTGPLWGDMSEKEINATLDRARETYHRSQIKKLDDDPDWQ